MISGSDREVARFALKVGGDTCLLVSRAVLCLALLLPLAQAELLPEELPATLAEAPVADDKPVVDWARGALRGLE